MQRDQFCEVSHFEKKNLFMSVLILNQSSHLAMYISFFLTSIKIEARLEEEKCLDYIRNIN